MLKRLLASFGIGSSKVNLVLDKQEFSIGESLRGRIIVEGGNIDQEINTLDVEVVMKFTIKGKEFSKKVDTIRVAGNFYTKAKATQEVPFEHYLPFHYPISKGSVSYHLVTKMDIAKSADTGDTDEFIVLPGKDMALILDALAVLGLREKIGSGRIGRYGQEFNYYPTTLYADSLKELEVKFYLDDQAIKLYLALSIATGQMIPMKHHTELAIPSELLAGGSTEQVTDYIKKFLNQELQLAAEQGPNTQPAYQNYQQQQNTQGRPGFGGFMGGMAAGLLGAAVLGSLFGGDESEATAGEDADADLAGSEDDGGGLFDGFDDFGGGDFF
ncbi:Sporulation-control protein spo0M [Sporotomaculum syntrophicum]|uniref:Sporulation-control protein spo0M n=1 Tax=Sporotomaculum syntrophicum TaxID=182264 RepID=A0A9D3AZ45_9FIRM|nr:sporulation protein [Sporotomaculum syntrophicum]KAF1085438.1 Sporulation-control protein spo0M [Sporotomaculum syntrophicum]